MDSSRLDAAHQSLLQAAAAAAEIETQPVQEPLSWLLSHIILHEETMAGAARQIAEGLPAVVDTAASLCADLIGRMVAEHRAGELIAQLAVRAAELVSLVEAIPEECASVAVRARLVSRRGTVVFDGLLGWRDLLGVRTEEHLPHYTRYVARLSAPTGANASCRHPF